MTENLAWGYTPDQVLYHWQISPEHEENLVNKYTNKVCIVGNVINGHEYYAMIDAKARPLTPSVRGHFYDLGK